MIRNAVVHLTGEQPVIVDLFDPPRAGDALLLCTNMRTLDGRRPVFIDEVGSTFVLPYLHIRFIEIRPERAEAAGDAATTGVAREAAEPAGDADLEIDEDFLRRIREA
ncbi:MAG: hypothetical protein A2V84_06435 [Chloroflexi bacterium RBG_16_70_13]|nr:MAG: hypothetical protein A2V84_06435 [Chloroflexi bacterium RBG_16_70_13]